MNQGKKLKKKTKSNVESVNKKEESGVNYPKKKIKKSSITEPTMSQSVISEESKSNKLPNKESVTKPHKETVTKPHKESVPKPHKETVTKPHKETVPKPHKETVPKPNKETVPKPHKESVPKPNKETVPKPHKESVPKSNQFKQKHTRRTMKLRGIIDDMMKQRPTQNNFEDLYKLEGFELHRDQYKKRRGL